jgi:hypothetical protein
MEGEPSYRQIIEYRNDNETVALGEAAPINKK